MLHGIENLPSVEQGVLALDSSWGVQTPKSVGPKDIKYVLVSPHDTLGEDRLGLDALPDEVKGQIQWERSLFEAYLHTERDAGVDELRQRILATCPGGISVSAQINRGILNFNRDSDTKEMPPIWTPEQQAVVAPHLRNIHRTGLADIDRILESFGDRVRVVCLHSMDPWSFKKGARPDLSPENFEAYVRAQQLPMENKTLRGQDFITGEEHGPHITDPVLYEVLMKRFGKRGLAFGENDPYDTCLGWPDYQYMLRFLRRVSAIDVTKTELCKGEAKEGAFTYTPLDPQPDTDKVQTMAEDYTAGIEAATA